MIRFLSSAFGANWAAKIAFYSVPRTAYSYAQKALFEAIARNVAYCLKKTSHKTYKMSLRNGIARKRG